MTEPADTRADPDNRSSAAGELLVAAQALAAGDLARTESLCRRLLGREPRNVAAMHLLGETALRLGRLEDAETLLTVCLELAPDFHVARHSYAELLFRGLRFREAFEETGKILASAPDHPAALLLRASMLTQVGSLDEALGLYDRLLEATPGSPEVLLGRAQALKTLGRYAEAVAVYRELLARRPDLGETWWSLANLKIFRFDDADIDVMQARLDDAATTGDDRLYLCFALGKALEDRGDHAASFRCYATGNALRRRTVRWDGDAHHAAVGRIAAYFDANRLATLDGGGHPSAAPIFIVGMPRAGSTLLEQILASHSQVEGTQELPDVLALVRKLNGRSVAGDTPGYPDVLSSLAPADFAALGAEYLERTTAYRAGAARFVDKMPNNFAYVGLIHLVLPNAVIIDARRAPLACGFSVFKQLFAHGQAFAYDFESIGRYYRDYVALMAHWDAVLPGRVLRVDYEALVTDTECEVRRLLAHCGLPFEPACLRFHETPRAVRTPSSEQVRRPVYRDGLVQWRHYEPHLAPLRAALAGEGGHTSEHLHVNQ